MSGFQAALEGDKPIASAIQGENRDKLPAELRVPLGQARAVVLNSDEGRQRVSRGDGQSALPALSAKIEEEIAQLPRGRAEGIPGRSWPEGLRRDRMVQACYNASELISFLTAGDDECRAWTIRSGTDAGDAAGGDCTRTSPADSSGPRPSRSTTSRPTAT